MWLEGNCRTTAMGIMPHTDIDRALELALSLDIPFFPQLPKVSFYEDMYVQASEYFPGITVDTVAERVSFGSARFQEELSAYSELMEKPEALALSPQYSVVWHRFLERDLSAYAAIRGQLTGPVSFGFKIVDESAKPIIYDEMVRPVLFDFLQRKANTQYRQLRARNKNAFVWLDEPGLGWVFSGLTGYNDLQAKSDYEAFVAGLEGPRGLHLCANVNLPYLLSLGVDVLSFDAYALEVMPLGYAPDIARFLGRGGIICWGIVPTDSTSLGGETVQSLVSRLAGYWEKVAQGSDLSPEQIARQALIAPARCCLKNTGQVGAALPEQGADGELGAGVGCSLLSTIEEQLVERAFGYLKEMSWRLRDRYGL